MSNALRNQLLKGATGQDHSGGGAYLQPGVHVVKIGKFDCFPSADDETKLQFVVEGKIVSSEGGQETWVMVGDRAMPASPPKPVDGMRPGTIFAWLQNTKFQVWKTRIGNFCLQVKKIQAQDLADKSVAEKKELLDFFVTNSPTQGPDTRKELETFFNSCEKFPHETVGDDISHIIDHGIAVDLLLQARCHTSKKKDLTGVVTDTVWDVLTPAQYAEAEAAAEELGI